MSEKDHGDQPLDQLLESWGLGNHDLVEISTEQLTHKQVQKARKGRELTLKMKMKVARALNVAIWGRLTNEEREGYFEYLHLQLFNYTKGYDANWVDPNAALFGTLEGRPVRKDVLRELGKSKQPPQR